MKALACLALLVASVHADTPPQQSEISLGAYLSMTGPTATFGTATQEGIQLAIDQYNVRAKRKVKLRVIDTAGKPSEGATAVTQLIDDGAVAIIGEVSSSITLAGAAVAQKRGIPMITPSATNPTVTDTGDMISRACLIDDAQAYALAKFAKGQRWKRVSILFDSQQPYSVGMVKAFEAEYKALGGTVVVSIGYDSGATDWKQKIQTANGVTPDAIFVPVYYNDAAAIAKQARALGIKTPLLGTDGWDSDQLWALGGNALIGSYYTTHFAADDRRTNVKAFVKAFTAKYQHAPDALAALGYDAANVMLDAIDRSKSLGGADLGAAIRATKDLKAVTGAITIDAKGNAAKPALILKVANGKPTLATAIPPKPPAKVGSRP